MVKILRKERVYKVHRIFSVVPNNSIFQPRGRAII